MFGYRGRPLGGLLEAVVRPLGSRGGLLGPLFEPLGALVGLLGGLWGSLGGVLGPVFWRLLGKQFEDVLGVVLGPFWGILGQFFGPLGGVLGSLGASWVPLGASWRPLGAFWGPLRAEGSNCRFVFPLFGPSWSRLGALLGSSWAVLERSGSRLGPFLVRKCENPENPQKPMNNSVLSLLGASWRSS